MSKELIEARDKAAKITAAADVQTKEDALYMMWALQRLGKSRPNVPFLIECCERMERALTQKTAGQPEYKKAGDVEWGAESDQLINMIIAESLALWRSGRLAKIREPEDETPAETDRSDTFDFLKPGKIKSNAPYLAELCAEFDDIMHRKERKLPIQSKKGFFEVESGIVTETMCLWASGNLWEVME